jgi:CubicO group peptidase (beta-lactamase class C family)
MKPNYRLKNLLVLRTLFYSIALFVGLCSCESRARKTETVVPKADLLAINPRPPLDPVEAKRYHDLIEEFISKNLSEKYFSGGILVAKNGVPVYERYSGFSNWKTKDSMTPETSLQVASTGKTLTSAAVLRLIQQGKLALQDPVTKFYPNFPYTEVTIKMLLNHRSGLPNYLYYMEKMNWNRKQTATNEDVMNTLINWKPPVAANPDRRYQYCNTNYVVLASIIEKVSGLSYAQYMKENFFKPLGMEHTFVRTPADSANVAYSYQFNGALWAPDFSDGPVGDKNIYSTCRDLLKWDQALYDEKIISPALLDSAFTPYSNEKPGIKNYGLGWHLLMLPNNKKVIYHHGKWHGFNAIFARLTDEQITIIMTGNKANMGVYRIAKKMYNLFGPYDGKMDDPGEE